MKTFRLDEGGASERERRLSMNLERSGRETWGWGIRNESGGAIEGDDVPFVFPKEGTKQMEISSDSRRDSWSPPSTIFTHVLKPSEMGLGRRIRGLILL